MPEISAVPAQNPKMIEESVDLQAKQIKESIRRECGKPVKYREAALVSFVMGILVWLTLKTLFDLNIEHWIDDPKAQRVKDLVNVSMYVLPLPFLAFSCATLLVAIADYALTWLSGGLELLQLKVKSRRVSRHSK